MRLRRSSRITVWADSGQFLGLLLYFGVSESFPRLTNPGVRLRVGHQHSHIRPILVRFMHYYSAFWGPRVIFMIDDPRVRLCVRRQHQPPIQLYARLTFALPITSMKLEVLCRCFWIGLQDNKEHVNKK